MFNKIRSVKKKHEKSLLEDRNIVACGIGYKEVGGAKTDELCMVVSVVKKVPLKYVNALVPLVIDGVKTDVQETGVFKAMQDRTGRWRPAPGGVSIGHPAVTAGTLSCLVQRSNETFILGNNHVLAASNLGRKGDPIIQPGSADSGVEPDDQIAELEEFVEVKFLLDQPLPECPTAKAVAATANRLARMVGSRHCLKAFQDDWLQMNLVDAAIARPLSPDMVTAEILEVGIPQGTVVGELGMLVWKSGRTTGLTFGEITAVDLTVQIMYGTDIALFTDQIQADAPCAGGDSGSAVLNEQNLLVGLLFAGSEDGTIMVMNRFENVVAELGLDETLPS